MGGGTITLLVSLSRGRAANTALVWARELPEGDRGIAARHAGDRGIEEDADVLFVEKFDVATWYR